MDQQVIAIICCAFVVASIFASYLKYRKKGADASEKQTQSVDEVMGEAFAYFGVETKGGKGVSHALDLAPVEMLSGLTTKPGHKTRGGRAKR